MRTVCEQSVSRAGGRGVPGLTLPPAAPRSSNSAFAVQSRSWASVTWAPPTPPLAVDRRDPSVLLSLLVSAVRRRWLSSARGAPPDR
jgi:hypothetical protein